jgi:GNAT superfamily N-acetyltransferase
MPHLTVRAARPADFLPVAALLAELGRPRLTPDTADAAQAVYERHVADPRTASLVAEEGGEAVGFLSLVFRDRLNCVQPQAWVPDLIVTERARGRGAARALLEEAFRRARAHGCDRITLESGYARTVAHQVYGALGMSNDGYSFSRSLAP